MKAVLMAGGFGTRIQPLTCSIPKPMIPLVNRPIMLHIVELLKKHGISDLVLLLYHQPEVIKNFFRDGSDFGVRITYVTPLADMGTAGAVKCAEKHLDERFLVISGDLLTDFNLQKVLDFHAEQRAQATITLTSVKDPLQFGVVITDKERRITQFLEKPGWGEVFSDTINTGIYVLEPEVLQLIPANENFDFSQDLFPLLLKNGAPLYGYPLKGYWRDIGNPDSYREAHHDIFRGKVNVRVDEPRQDTVGKDLRVGSDVRVEAAVGMEGMVVIGDNSQLLGNAHLKDCIIGRNCTIEAGAKLSRCILWDNVYVKRGARLSDCVLCDRVSVGSGSVIEEGVVVADDTSIGEDAYLKRDVKVWPRKVIEPGATVTDNLIWGEKWRKSLFEGAAVKGLANVELTPEFVAKLGCAYGSTLPKGSYVLANRDLQRSSRMLKRSFIGGLLSAGVNVRDLKTLPMPVMRYKLNSFGEVGGVQFRQGEEDAAMTEIVFLDGDGLDFSSSHGKGVERVFYKENFRRAHHSEPGGLSELPAATDFYREGFKRALDRTLLAQGSTKVVIDFNHSTASLVLPGLLAELGCEVIGLNGHLDEERGVVPETDQTRSLSQLAKIVTSLEARAGFWLDPTAEAIILVDDSGRVLAHHELLTLLAALVLKAGGVGSLVVPVSAPSTVERMAATRGCSVRRTKSAERAMLEAARAEAVLLVASMDGRIIFPAFQPAFDGMFAIAKTIELAARSDQPLSRTLAELPGRAFLRGQVACALEMKGGVMRRMSEESADQEASYLDGIKVSHGDDWVLVLPDQSRPLVHVVVEARDEKAGKQLLDGYRKKLESWKKELA